MRVARKLILVPIAVFVAAGCGGTTSSGAPDTEKSTREATVAPTPSIGGIACGQEFRESASGELTMVARFPASAAAADGVVTGTVEVTSKRAVQGVVSPRAQAFLVRDGRVVSMPVVQDLSGVRWDLASGAVERLPADAALVSCEPGGAPLPPGRYELYARLMVTPDDGPGVVSVAGPWPLEIT
jgi:hypothetical protein